MSRRPVHGHACNVASPTEDSVVVVAVKIQDSQTAKGTIGSDAAADKFGDADATHTAGTTVAQAPKSLRQIFSKGPNFAAIEQSGQDQGRVHLPLGFFREVLMTKEVFQNSARCCSRFDALEDIGVRGERLMNDRAQTFEALTELYKPHTVDEKERRARSCVRLTWR